jgi:glycosyltransferase involved in cell wall biosynthesis
VSGQAIAVVICTRNRASLLERVLDGYADQTLDRASTQIVVIDDGSTDDTVGVIRRRRGGPAVWFGRQRASGLASARNHGLFMATAPVVLFADDDDVPDRALLERHVDWHRRCPALTEAMLGRTILATAMADDPLMHFVTEIDGHLFSYGAIRDGQDLGFSHFWGGRVSCKRAFLLEHGIFDARFKFGCEDIELAFRLSRHGLRVQYNARAVTTMVRALSLDEFCQRLWRQGRSNYLFTQLHPDARVREWADVEAVEAMVGVLDDLDQRWATARTLDTMARNRVRRGLPLHSNETRILHHAYRAAMSRAKAAGFLEARGEALICS